ncbi:MAG TPA: TetR/AcrR family transcriptional regulator [Flexivirga sp.]|uniref:TetR/AcrR family transcriptional regulator n=1 Tax=Flexivirga sp. TaxID=1962927 RepID=UPI002B6AA2D3|nr:TetR/AcrR family transcriptional regulator [Flexivirga sp.]HWC23764.1 TetR/AcrR family transcriptional regulator [Flexivirga sp.]
MPKRSSVDPRSRIIEVASQLLREQGRVAVTTRRVAELASVQAPVIYRLFGDKDGLLDAVAEQVMAEFTAAKTAAASSSAESGDDPIASLRAGWDMTIGFGLANPELFVLLSDPARTGHSPSAEAGLRVLGERVHRVAMTGRLRVSEQQAVELIHAAGTGAVLAILGRPEPDRDLGLADILFDALCQRILTTEHPTADAPDGVGAEVAPAVALRASVGDLDVLSAGERTLFAEWLDRIVEHG